MTLPSTLSLAEARLAATEAVKRIDANLELSAISPQHDSTYVELLVSDHACRREPCRVLVSLDRDVTQDTFREAVSQAVKRQFHW